MDKPHAAALLLLWEPPFETPASSSSHRPSPPSTGQRLPPAARQWTLRRTARGLPPPTAAPCTWPPLPAQTAHTRSGPSAGALPAASSRRSSSKRPSPQPRQKHTNRTPSLFRTMKLHQAHTEATAELLFTETLLESFQPGPPTPRPPELREVCCCRVPHS